MSDWGTKLIRLTVIVFAASFLWACEGDDGNDGARGPQGDQGDQGLPGPQGPPGEDPPILVGDGGALTMAEIEELGKLTATITGVTIASPPVVDFTVVDQHGNPAEGIASGYVWFTFAKLVPNGDPDVNGGLPYWQSYINRVEDVANNAVGRGSDVLDLAIQATNDSRFSGGSHVEVAPGRYQYTFGTDVTDVTAPIPVAWEPGLTHRVGLEIRLDGPGEVPLAPDNDVFDFVPDDGAGSGVTRNILETDKCNGCHFEFAFHGGPRKSMEYCVTCHNPGTVDQDSGESLDMAYMAHSIHMGDDRQGAVDFTIWGFSDFAHPYAEVTYPGTVVNCETCHEASDAAPDGDAWNEGATAKACGGCHADGLVAENFDAVTGVAEYSFDHSVSDFAGAGIQQDGSCSGCHLGNIPVAGDALSIHSRLSTSAASARERWRGELGENYIFNIIDVTGTGPGETPVITFSVTDAAGEFWDILGADEFNDSNASMNLYVSWPGIENYNGEEGGATGGDRLRIDGETGMPGEPSYYGAGHPNRMYLQVIQYYIANEVGASLDNGDGTYTVEYFTSLPEDFTGSAMVAIGGHPAAFATNADGEAGFTRAAATSVVWYPEGAAREFAVAADNCNVCHQKLQAHGSNRNGNPEMCLVCHNADLVEGDEGYALGRMIHSIHSASPSFSGGGFAEVTYPQSVANCDTCHVEGAYNAARTVARSVSISVGEDETVWTDDPATTPTSQACGNCHTSVAAMGHFNTQGGAIGITKDLIMKVGGLPNGMEACAVCHGPGREFDTTQYHNPGIEE